MKSNKDCIDRSFNLSDDQRNNYSFPNNSIENNYSGEENKRDSIMPNNYPSILQNLNNSQDENDNFENDRPNDSPNCNLSIGLNSYNPQNGIFSFEDDKFNDSLYFGLSSLLNINNSNDSLNFHSLNSVSINDPQYEKDNIEYDSPNFFHFISLNENNPLNGEGFTYNRLNLQIENNIIEDDRLYHRHFLQSFNQNSNDSFFENDNFNYGRQNVTFNSLFAHLNVNNPQIENDNIENGRFIESLNANGSIHLNSINSHFENDSFSYGRPNESYNSLIPHFNVNNPQFENDSIENSINEIPNANRSIHINENLLQNENENDNSEDGRFNDNPNVNRSIHINVNNSQVENDNIGNEERNSDRIRKKFTIQKNANELKSNSKEILKRNDYAKKYFKTHFCKFLKNHANKIIQKSMLPKKFKKKKIYAPNSLSFTANTKQSEDYKFLFFSIKKILTYYIKNKKNKYQKQNKETIEEILNFIDESEDESIYEEVKSFFNMTLENAYELFYQDEEFTRYKEDEKVIKNDEEVKLINRVSFREKYGFTQFVKSHFKKNEEIKSIILISPFGESN